MQPPPTFNLGLTSNFFFVYRTLSMRQKTENHQNQRSIDKKFDFFPQSLTHIPRWVHLVQKTRAKNSHAWAPLRVIICKTPCILSGSRAVRYRNGKNAEAGTSPVP